MNAPPKNITLMAPASVPYPKTNSEFLLAAFGTGEQVCTTSFQVNPAGAQDRHWKGSFKELPAVAARDEANSNTYFCCSTFNPAANGQRSRQKGHFKACHVVMVDDVTADGLDRLRQQLEPSYVLETSPGNLQVGYFIHPNHDEFMVSEVIRAVNNEAGDQSCKGVTRYCRLPYGVNTKSEPSHVVRLIDWQPNNRYVIGSLILELGLRISDVSRDARRGLGRGNENLDEEDYNTLWEILGRYPPDAIADPDDPDGLQYDVRETDREDNPERLTIGWLQVVMAAHHTDPSEDNRDRVEEWSSQGSKYQPGEVTKRWAGFGTGKGGVTVGTLLMWRRLRERGDARRVAEQMAEGRPPVPLDYVKEFPDTFIEYVGKSQTIPKANYTNAGVAIQMARYWVRFDTFTNGYYANGVPLLSRPIAGAAAGSYELWGSIRKAIEVAHGTGFAEEHVTKAVHQMGNTNPFNVLTEYMRSVPVFHPDSGPTPLDGLFDALGLDPDSIQAKMIHNQLLAGVARALHPGAKVHTVCNLVGAQGAWKTSFVKALVPHEDWYLATMPADITKKDELIKYAGKMIVDWDEMATIRKAHTGDIKGHITQSEDEYRAPYDVTSAKHKRQFVFWGTGNRVELRDTTGSRRYYIVTVDQLDLKRGVEWLRLHRDRMYGQLVWEYDQRDTGGNHLYRWWFETGSDEEKEQFRINDKYQRPDPLVEILATHIEYGEGAFTPGCTALPAPLEGLDPSVKHFVRADVVTKAVNPLIAGKTYSSHDVVRRMTEDLGWSQWNSDDKVRIAGKWQKVPKGLTSPQLQEVLDGLSVKAEQGRVLVALREYYGE